MKTNKTECPCLCHVTACAVLHNDGPCPGRTCSKCDCQKEQPEQEVHDKLMNMALDHAKSAAHPPVLFTPPQELRQEEWEKKLECFDFPTAWRLVRLTKPEQHHEKCSWRVSEGGVLCDCVGMDIARVARNDLKTFIKNVEQKARAEAFKAVKALVPIESYSYYGDYGWKRVYDINDVPENYPKEHIRKHYPDEWHEFYESLLKLQKS